MRQRLVSDIRHRQLHGVWRALRTCALLLLAWCSTWHGAQAHEATMVDLRVREVAPGDFVWTWGIPAKGRPVSEDLSITWPAHCEVRGQAMRCGSTGLQGSMAVEGVGRAYSAVIMRLYWYNGPTQVITLTEAMPSVRLFGGGQDKRGAAEVAQSYGILGVEHILTGWDHLLFVISLLILVGFNRRLVMTVTAFTLAHSLTLATSALGWLSLRPAPVEACIALSIVLVCAEALRQRQTLARRWPALVALVFGLVHGLGFAGALKEIGLPQDHLLVALLSFNLGVEAGQLVVVLVCWGIAAAAARLPWRSRLQGARPAADAQGGGGAQAVHHPGVVVLLYGIGALAAYWTLARLAAIMGG